MIEEKQFNIIQQHMDQRFNRLEAMLADVASQGINNNRDLARFEERLKSGAENFCKNDKQHAEFYSKINELEKRADTMDGGLKIANRLLAPLIIGVLTALVLSLLKL